MQIHWKRSKNGSGQKNYTQRDRSSPTHSYYHWWILRFSQNATKRAVLEHYSSHQQLSVLRATLPSLLLNQSDRLGVLQAHVWGHFVLTSYKEVHCRWLHTAYFTYYSLSYSHMLNQHFTELGVPDKGEPGLNPLCTTFLEPAALYKSIFEDALR